MNWTDGGGEAGRAADGGIDWAAEAEQARLDKEASRAGEELNGLLRARQYAAEPPAEAAIEEARGTWRAAVAEAVAGPEWRRPALEPELESGG